MAEAATAEGLGHTTTRMTAGGALKMAAGLWLLTTLAGQWVFLYYIAAFYGGSTLSGNFQAWSRNDALFKGYVAGDAAGNLFFAAHVLLAAAVAFGGTLQMVPQIRKRALWFHRWNGRVFLATAGAAALAGLYMVWVRGASANLLGALAISLDAVLILGFATLAWRSALGRQIADHRRWAMRAFLAANGVWFYRVGFMAWIAINHGPVGSTRHLDGPFDIFWEFGCYLLPLAMLELHLRAERSGGGAARLAMAGGLAVSSVVIAIGVAAAYAIMWRPLLG
ncbi:DUF2306 domain-containing protein [Phenylobacterium montanum]|uniref:DUF2306 domain-containing protein n=1 Tax=Phenylobacterium montanum TaxID=2823693 RepID=A0A975IUT7_9CAUL|nr:DUF2306 domain-containing protein [Caulobacter sp. S6]QUD88095.1 DUF2306 domain-containing protein [Caulobacter sp. S6]